MSASENVRAVIGRGKPYSRVVQISNVDELAEELADLIPGGGGEGTRNHQALNNRDVAGCHPSTSVSHGGGTVSGEIEGLKTAVAAKADADAMTTALNAKADKTALNTETTERQNADAALQDRIDNKADSAALGSMAYEDDAPADGKEHVRKDGAWVESSGGGSGGPVAHSSTTGRDLPNQHQAPAINVGTEASPVGLDVKLAEMDAALAAETAARETDDAAMQGQIAALDQTKADASALAAETSARTGGDNALQYQISNETDARITADAGLQDQIAALNDRITYGTTDLVAGTSALPTGAVYLVYE